MKAQNSCCLFLTLAMIFLFSFPSECSGMTGPTIELADTVFVAFLGQNLSIEVNVHKPTNQTSEDLRCLNPLQKEICHTPVSPAHGKEDLVLQLTNLTISGMYICKYNKAEVKWFLRVVAKDQTDYQMDYRVIIVPVFIGIMLVFSVVGSVYVFRGHWKEINSNSLGTRTEQKQNREDRQETEKEEDNMDMTTAQSSSFYASLEPRTRSIYDVLDHSAANSRNQQMKTQAEPSEVVEQNGEHQEEGFFESVYENF